MTQNTKKTIINKPTKKEVSNACKTALLTVMLNESKGATLTEMAEALGWKENSVRGAISLLVKNRSDIVLCSEKKDGVRRYRLVSKD